MIALSTRFGRSAYSNRRIFFIAITVFLLPFLLASEGHSIGQTGLFATKFKAEYQFSDYTKFSYPQIDGTDSIKYEYLDPYILNFPEHRTLGKITQSFGPMTAAELRYEFSKLTSDKDQNRVYARVDRNLNDLTSIYAATQYMGISYDSPDSTASNGYMGSIGVKYDRSGWIKGEASFSFDQNRSSNDLLTKTYLPMLKARWSINAVTALSARWDGYWAVSDSGTYPAQALTIFVSRYLPTQTAVHLFSRFYTSEDNVQSISPSIEVAQYIFWNLTLRLTYRYYQNSFDEANAPEFIDGGSLTSHAVRAYLEWQPWDALKLHLKLRHYQSDQNIEMNTYLLGMEYEI